LLDQIAVHVFVLLPPLTSVAQENSTPGRTFIDPVTFDIYGKWFKSDEADQTAMAGIETRPSAMSQHRCNTFAHSLKYLAAADCKSLHPDSIPGEGSITAFQTVARISQAGG